MRLALTRPELIERLVVVDVAPVAYADTFGPFVQAMRRVDLAAVQRRADADLQLQDAVPDAALRNFLLQNLVKTDAGFVWRVNLDALAANMDELVGFPPPAHGAAYLGRTLFMAGGRSRYIQPEHRPLIERLFPKAEHVVIAERRPLAARRAPGRVPHPRTRVSRLTQTLPEPAASGRWGIQPCMPALTCARPRDSLRRTRPGRHDHEQGPTRGLGRCDL